MTRPNAMPKPDALDRIKAKRAADYLLHLTWYCEGRGCPAREIEVTVKDHDATLLPSLERRAPVCPICRRGPLTLHAVMTAREFDAAEDAYARSSVNRQRYERDHPGELGVPLGVFLDDSLPS
jgi:hypothetical protein